MSHLGGYQLVDGHGRRGTGTPRRARALARGAHVVFPLRRTSVGGDLEPVPPPPPARRRGRSRPPRQVSTCAFVLTMVFSFAKVAASWQPALQVVRPPLGSERVAEARECPDYPPLPAGPND